MNIRKTNGLWDTCGQMAALALAFMIPISTAVTTYLMITILVSWGLGGDREEKYAYFYRHPLFWTMAPLIAMAVVGVSYSTGDAISIQRALMDGLRLMCIPILLFYYRTPGVAQKALWLFCAAMVLTLGLGFLKVYAGLPIGTKYTVGAVFKSHIKTSFFMALAAFFIAYQQWDVPRFRRSMIVVSLLMLYYLFCMNIGRVGHITLGVCAFYVAWHRFRWKGIMGAIVLTGVIFGGAYQYSSVFSERVNLLWQDWDRYHEGRLIESSLGSRMHFAVSSFNMMASQLWIGSGTGSFAKTYKHHRHDENAIETDNPHNEYLRVGVELGLVGMLCLVFMFVQQWRLSKNVAEPLRGCLRGFLLAFYVGCFLNSWLKDFTEGYFYCVMLAIGFCALPLSGRRRVPQGVSLIVTTYNWPGALNSVLQALSEQRYAHWEVIVADDGSTNETAQIIRTWKEKFPVPLIHCWQSDCGFRAGMVRNRAVARAQYEYLIFIDGDCVVPRDFVSRHVALAETGWFVAGSRILLSEAFTSTILANALPVHRMSAWQWCKAWWKGQCNRWLAIGKWPLGPLRKIFPARWQGAKTCNLGMWKQDFIRVNGFDESFEGWGFEDSDCVIRLQRSGIYRKTGKFFVSVFHLWHPNASRAHADENAKRLEGSRFAAIRSVEGVEQYF